ncbi:MAG: acyl-CoA dehydrogenase [Hydrocarboniphaga sp.]|uniref:acyl-CoA dehydrogenase family protein n=1 Tax=Hydrocarboniphaga sp. TaxID=2033016 RepID=UPI00260E59E2|nr:acyl-CoA dehydrogenase family protein [Hydrocarboniphaga sp.]MDB5968728.1 acyl-CoA dehydrogenase [Hydrocarboniphaga sp.]
MQLEFDAFHQAFREEIRAFVRENLPPEMARRQKQLSFPGNRSDILEWMRILHRRRWSVPNWPVEYGGTNWTPLQHFIFERESQEADAPGLFRGGTHMVGPVIYTFGSEDQKSKFLPAIREGRFSWAQGFSEPGAGSDLSSLRTTALLRGDRYVVNGQKIWTSGAHLSAWGYFLVRTDTDVKPQNGVSLLLIDLATPGITIRQIPQIDGDAHLCEVFLENVEVPAENLVGKEGAGWTYGKFLLDNERTFSSFIYWNIRELRKAKEIAQRETMDGTPLAQLPTFRARLAQAEARVLALEWSVLRVLAQEARPHKLSVIASALKLRGSELQQLITELQVDLLGARSLRFYAPSETEQLQSPDDAFWPDYVPGKTGIALITRAASIYGGSRQVQRNLIAKHAFGL